MILTYHRIADDPVDHWELAVSPAHFEEQLDVLRRTRHPLPLADFVRGLMAGSLPPNAVALTFDDGYIDNLLVAKPRLAAADVPATVFLTTGFVDRSGGFWWDELARLILLEKGPRSFDLMVRGESVHFDVGTEPPMRADGTSKSAMLTRRKATIGSIWRTIRCLGDEERELIMAQLRSTFANGNYRAWPDRIMTSAEVRALVADGLVTIGAHTVNHPTLSALDTVACHHEIIKSKLACEALTAAPV
ncbi:MAG: polysaccharide deacetylase family protein, partial [Bradyrhizobium sp.]|nr:polysaccharide deacetylase family protein [Bradyrhizobium sp.]